MNSSETQNEKTESAEKPARRILQRDPKQAVKALTRMTKALVDLANREATVLRKNDMHGFANLHNEKMILTERYVQMSQEFRNRIEDFRDHEDLDLDTLEQLQTVLQDKAKENNLLLERAQAHMHQRTSDTLLNAQEIAQENMNDEDAAQNLQLPHKHESQTSSTKGV